MRESDRLAFRILLYATVSFALLFGTWYCDMTTIRPLGQSLEESSRIFAPEPEASVCSLVSATNQTSGVVSFRANCSQGINPTVRLSGAVFDASRAQLARALGLLHELELMVTVFEIITAGFGAIGYTLGFAMLLSRRRTSHLSEHAAMAC